MGAAEISLDSQMVVSELVTNAVRAEAQHLSFALDGHTYVRVATSDDAPGVSCQADRARKLR
jgi:hypothetical protein